MDKKDSLLDENKRKAEEEGEEVLEREYREKMKDGAYSLEFKENYSTYVKSWEEWKEARGYSLTMRTSHSDFLIPNKKT